MCRKRFGTTRQTPNSVAGLISLPAVRLILAIEAMAALSVLALTRG